MEDKHNTLVRVVFFNNTTGFLYKWHNRPKLEGLDLLVKINYCLKEFILDLVLIKVLRLFFAAIYTFILCSIFDVESLFWKYIFSPTPA